MFKKNGLFVKGLTLQSTLSFPFGWLSFEPVDHGCIVPNISNENLIDIFFLNKGHKGNSCISKSLGKSYFRNFLGSYAGIIDQGLSIHRVDIHLIFSKCNPFFTVPSFQYKCPKYPFTNQTFFNKNILNHHYINA